MKAEFVSAVNNHELAKVRMMLSNELFLDPRGGTFSEMLAFAKNNLADLFDENKESNYEIPIDKALWDNALASRVKRDLNSNFSIEKLALFQEIAMWVGRDKAQSLEEEEQRRREEERRRGTLNYGDDEEETDAYGSMSRNKKRVAGTIATASGAVLAIYAIGAGKVLLSVLGGGAIVVGGILLYSSSKN